MMAGVKRIVCLMPNLIEKIGREFDKMTRCKRVDPCFVLFISCIAGCAIATGGIYMVKGPGEIVELSLFCTTVGLVCLLFFSHAYYIQRNPPLPLPLQQQQTIENV